MKKIGAILLSLLLVISSLGTFSFAADAVEKPSIGFESVQAEAGETLSLPLYVRKNSGIAGVSVSLKYDTNVLTLKETKKGSLFSGFTAGKNFVWDESENVTTDGILATFTFTVAEQAPAGEYGIQVIVRSCVNSDLDDVACDTINGIVTVADKQVAVTGITLNKDSLSLSEGASETLIATVTPDDAANKAVTWTSSNESVATVDGNGKVTAVKKGTAVITAITEDGSFTASCQVNVSCSHTYVEKVAPEYLKSPATTTSKAVYYKSCSACGEKSSETFEYGEKLPDGNTARIIVESSKEKVRVGQTVQVDVSIQNNPGFGGMAYDINYDNTVLELVSYELGIGGEICTDSGKDIYPDKMNFQYAGISNVTGDGVLVSLTFRVKDSAQVGVTSISVTPEEGTFFFYQDRVEIDFSVECRDNSVEIVNYIPGDVNGDERVNNRDAARLMQYLAGWDVEVVDLALDINGDGKINNRDAARLMQSLAGWDVEIY